MTRPLKLVITLPEYERIFRTVHPIVNLDKHDEAHSSLFFNILGAAILVEHFGLEASPVCGSACFNLGGQPNELLIFDEDVGSDHPSYDLAFHCWTEVNGMIIDFSAPLFHDVITAAKPGLSIERKMFQKPVNYTSTSMGDTTLAEVASPGSFVCNQNPEITKMYVEHFVTLPSNRALLDLCLNWFRRPPKRMDERRMVGTDDGRTAQLSLSPIRVIGAW